jgi:hypothetical protein
MKARRLLLALAVLLGVASFSLAADPLRTLSQKLKRELKAKPCPLLAVIDFPYSLGRMSTGSYLITERLVTYLVQDGAPVVERHLMESLLAEKKMSETGIVDPNTIKSMSRVLGVDAVVVGTLADSPDEDTTEVMARIVKVETGEILSAATIITERLWRDAPRLPRIAQARVPVPIAYPLEDVNVLIPNPPASPRELHLEPRRGESIETNSLTRKHLAIDGRMKKPKAGTVIRDFPYAPAAVPVAVPMAVPFNLPNVPANVRPMPYTSYPLPSLPPDFYKKLEERTYDRFYR